MKTITNTNSVLSKLAQFKAVTLTKSLINWINLFGKMENVDPGDGLAVLELLDSLEVQMLETPGVVEGEYFLSKINASEYKFSTHYTSFKKFNFSIKLIGEIVSRRCRTWQQRRFYWVPWVRLIKRNAMKVCIRLRWKRRRYVELLADGGLPISSVDSRLCVEAKKEAILPTVCHSLWNHAKQLFADGCLGIDFRGFGGFNSGHWFDETIRSS